MFGIKCVTDSIDGPPQVAFTRDGRVTERDLESVFRRLPPAHPVADRSSPSGRTDCVEVVVLSVLDRL